MDVDGFEESKRNARMKINECSKGGPKRSAKKQKTPTTAEVEERAAGAASRAVTVHDTMDYALHGVHGAPDDFFTLYVIVRTRVTQSNFVELIRRERIV